MLVKFVQFSVVYIFVFEEKIKKDFLFFSIFFLFLKDFVSISCTNPHKTTLTH